MVPSPLPGLPGSDEVAGTGVPVRSLFEGLLDDDAAVRPGGRPVAAVVARRRSGAADWYRDCLAAVHVPASCVKDLLAALTAADTALPVVLASDVSGLDGLREARNAVFEDPRVELVGVHVGLPEGMTPPAGARALLDALDFSVPARVDTALAPGWRDALSVLAADGAEEVGLDMSGAQAGSAQPPSVTELAAFLRTAVDLDLAPHCTRGPDAAMTVDGRPGLINVMCAIRAALNGAEVGEVAEILAEEAVAPLASAVRRMSDADAAVVRAFLASCACAEPFSLVEDLVALGLLDPLDAG
jgi:hypothetical protein